jgi:6-phosphofructokinase 1
MGKAAVDCLLQEKRKLHDRLPGGRSTSDPLQEVIKGKKTPELGMFEIARVLSI